MKKNSYLNKKSIYAYWIYIVTCVVLCQNKIQATPMALKYQHEIEHRNLRIECPRAVTRPNNQTACRFIRVPLDNKITRVLSIALPKTSVIKMPIKYHANFFPNIVIDRILGHRFDYENGDPEAICSRCGISLYNSISNAKQAWKNMRPRVKAKWNFTHILSGTIMEMDGYMGEINHEGHFGFYEDINADLSASLNIIEPL